LKSNDAENLQIYSEGIEKSNEIIISLKYRPFHSDDDVTKISKINVNY